MFQFSIGEPNTPAMIITLVIGLVLALALAALLMRKEGVTGKGIALALVLSPVLGCLFSHLFYCLMQLSFVLYDLGARAFIDFSAGKHMLYGGMFGVFVALLIASKASGVKFGKIADGFAPAGFLFIVAVRLAEGYFGQGYGEYIEEINGFCRFPFAAYDPYYESWNWALFAGEAVCALLIFVITLCMKGRQPAGDRALLGLGMYASAQIIFESLRRDDFLRWGFVRCSELFSGILLLTVLVIYLVRGKNTGHNLAKTLWMVLFFAMVALCMLLEFATEGRIPFLQFLETPAQCYLVMTACCAVILGCVLAIRHLSYAKEEALAA